MRRLYDEAVAEHFKKYKQMLFLSGPWGIGKTTTSLRLKEQRELHYFDWDMEEDRLLILEGAQALVQSYVFRERRSQDAQLKGEAHSLKVERRLQDEQIVASAPRESATPVNMYVQSIDSEKPILVLDELYKRRLWKGFLKGLYDKHHREIAILVTGSARLDLYQLCGDSLMGRYFQYRLHPLSVRELIDPSLPTAPIREPRPMDQEQWERLCRFGGFPEPFLEASESFSTHWSQLRRRQLFRHDLRELTQVQQIAQMELLAEWIRRQVGSTISYSFLAKHVRISDGTVRRWLEILGSLFYVFALRPWADNVPRSLTKEPKYYLGDWSSIEDPNARAKNFVGAHLLKAVQFWTDHGFGEYGLYYLRDRQKREVDFVVVRNRQPWMLVEVKSDGHGISPHLHYFAKVTGAPHVFQIAFDAPYVDIDCFELKSPRIIPARTLLSQLI